MLKDTVHYGPQELRLQQKVLEARAVDGNADALSTEPNCFRPSSVFEDPLISNFTIVMMKGGSKVLARSFMTQALKAGTRKQFEKFHAASAEEQANTERNTYTIFHQVPKICEPEVGLVDGQPLWPGKGGHFYQVPVLLANQRHRFLVVEWMITERRKKLGRC
ncbi:hypothetical protein QTO34_004477 [Cnephaeus nilssonii]|uniref:Small ribosomal subunit protein uS7 domain-containing protein n=1 Tax=Cnephaeus nilssonii TaxID=3371016 RepID=A0AA40LJE0_CNENI|nr:hypothetical protein QTO34_004477 [Eptesicus nilssonii]